MDIKSIGVCYAAPFYGNTMKNKEGGVATKSKNWPSNFPKRLAASAKGFTATAIINNELNGLQVSSEDYRRLRKLLDSMLVVICNLQKNNAVLQAKMEEVERTNIRFRKNARR